MSQRPLSLAGFQVILIGRFWVTAEVSERKLKANRENAKKSTGPKTLRGKAFSRRNALKHGLFVNHFTDFEAFLEDPEQYRDLLNGLWDQYQPVGRGEEIQVERIALCCWRLKRAWRYENAVNLAARRDFVRAELDVQKEYCKERDKEEEAVILQLQCARKEIEELGQVSQDLKQRIFAMMPGLEELWSALDKTAQKHIEEADAKIAQKLTPQWIAWAREIYAVRIMTAHLEQISQVRSANVKEAAYGRHAIPNPEALDKILRYETTIERSMDRALNQLEHLQRRRTGEASPPQMSVHLA